MAVKIVFSPLCTRTVPTKKYGSRQGKSVEKLIIHHTAGGTDESNVRYLSAHSRKVSASYVLQTTGFLVGIVPENFRPWTSGSFAADGDAVTVETVNVTRSPDWKVSPAQLETLAQLAVDLYKRYKWDAIDRDHVKGHREFAQTSCPGPFLWPRVSDTKLEDSVIRRANEILNGEAPKPAPKPKPLERPTPPRSGGKTIAQMALEVIDGKHGNGHENRQKSLGVDNATYQLVRDEVNTRLGFKKKPKPAKPTPTTKSIAQMALEVIRGYHGTGHVQRQKSLGVDSATYRQVRDMVNDRVYAKTLQTTNKTIQAMALEVIAGKHGNGHATRQRSLRVDDATYQRVRARVNELV